MACPPCQPSIPAGSRFCPGCGQPAGGGAIAIALFLALAVAAVTVLSVSSDGGVSQRFLDARYQALSITLGLLVLVRIGLFASAIMFVTSFVLLRVPYTFDSSSLYAGQAWFALAALIGLSAAGFWMARRNPRAVAIPWTFRHGRPVQ